MNDIVLLLISDSENAHTVTDIMTTKTAGRIYRSLFFIGSINSPNYHNSQYNQNKDM